jgi:hypothetical protein
MESEQTAESSVQRCEREAREWDATAELATAALAHDPTQAGRVRAVCMANAEEWRARLRRCQR